MAHNSPSISPPTTLKHTLKYRLIYHLLPSNTPLSTLKHTFYSPLTHPRSPTPCSLPNTDIESFPKALRDAGQRVAILAKITADDGDYEDILMIEDFLVSWE